MDDNIDIASQCKGLEKENALNDGQITAVATLSLVSACLSLFGSGSVLICSIYHRRVFNPEIFPTFHLATADVLSSAMLMISSSIFLHAKNNPDLEGNERSCTYLMEVVISFYTTAFFLTITYAMEVWLRFRRKLQAGMSLDALGVRTVSSRWMYLVYVLAWFVPLILALVLIMKISVLSKSEQSTSSNHSQCSACFADFQFNEDVCWQNEDCQVSEGEAWHGMIKGVFLIPLIMVMVSNMILYILIRKSFRQVVMRRGLLSYHQRQEESLLRRKTFLYQSVFFVCWLPSVILGIASLTNGYYMSTYFPLLVLQAILGPLQGMFNSIVYGWRRDTFRHALTEGSSLLSTNRTTTMSVTL